MATKVNIANIPMALIGEDTIISLTSGLGEKERKVNALWDTTRDETLRVFPWNFAKTQADLALVDDTPIIDSEYSYIYQLPSDFIRFIENETNENCEIYGDKLYSNEETLAIKYIRRVEDVSLWDSCFIDAFSAKLAMKLAYSIANSNTLQQSLNVYFEKAMKSARGIASQESTSDPLYADVLTLSRY